MLKPVENEMPNLATGNNPLVLPERPYERMFVSSIFDGYVLTPLLMALSDHRDIERLLTVGVSSSETAALGLRLQSAYFFLESKGLIELADDVYHATDLGRFVFKRIPALRVAHSYDIYMQNLPEILFDPGAKIHVDRAINVRGAGAMNKKYFEEVASYYRTTNAHYLLDIGCGDGTNLAFALECNPNLKLIGVDFEDPSLHATRKRFSAMNLDHEPLFFHGDVKQPEAILDELTSRGIDPADVLTSVWFIFHEVLGQKNVALGDLLSRYRPLAEHGLIIGEIFALPPEHLAEHGKGSAAATFLYLHYLSGQLPLSKESWENGITASGLSTVHFIEAEKMERLCRTGIWVLRGDGRE